MKYLFALLAFISSVVAQTVPSGYLLPVPVPTSGALPSTFIKPGRPLGPTAYQDSYAAGYDVLINGGFVSVGTSNQISQLPASTYKEGKLIHAVSDHSVWAVGDGLTNFTFLGYLLPGSLGLDLYRADGTLTGHRVVSGAGYSLTTAGMQYLTLAGTNTALRGDTAMYFQTPRALANAANLGDVVTYLGPGLGQVDFQPPSVLSLENIAEFNLTSLSTNTLVYIRGYRAAGDGGGGLFQRSLKIVGDLVTSFTSGDGAVFERTDNGPIDIRWGGASLTNSSYTQAAIVNSLAAAKDGRWVTIPPGTWTTLQLNITPSTTKKLRMYGVFEKAEKIGGTNKIKLAANATGPLLTVADTVYCDLRDLFFDGNYSQQTNTYAVISLEGASYGPPHLENVCMQNGSGDGLYVNRSEVYLNNLTSMFNRGNGLTLAGGDIIVNGADVGNNEGDGILFYGNNGGRFTHIQSYLNSGHGAVYTNVLNLHTEDFVIEMNKKSCITIGGVNQLSKWHNGIIRGANIAHDQNNSTNGCYPTATYSLVEFRGTGSTVGLDFDNVTLQRNHPTIDFMGANKPKYYWDWQNTVYTNFFGFSANQTVGFQTTETDTGLEASPNIGNVVWKSVLGNLTGASGSFTREYIFTGYGRIDYSGTYLNNLAAATTGKTAVAVGTDGKLYDSAVLAYPTVTVVGDASVTISGALPQELVYGTALTAVRNITLPAAAGIVEGARIGITHGAIGSNNLQVLNSNATTNEVLTVTGRGRADFLLVSGVWRLVNRSSGF